jgi:hypothetical protein
MFQNKMLSVKFGSETVEMIKRCKTVQKKETHNLSSLPDIIRVITSRRMRLIEHVACMGEMINVTTFWSSPSTKREVSFLCSKEAYVLRQLNTVHTLTY